MLRNVVVRVISESRVVVLTSCEQVTDTFDNGHGGCIVLPMKFTCHAIVDAQGATLKWFITGCDRVYRGSFLETLKDRVRLEFPAAEFEEGKPIPWGSERF